jgi:quercetin dioxygenase-like cupin family protein
MAGATVAEDVTHLTAVNPGVITWKDDPDLQKGAQFANLYGDPSKPGLFVQRIKLPANFQVAPHTHPDVEAVVVLSGTINVGEGDKFDKTKTLALKTGSFYAHPAKRPHFAWTSEETIIQLSTNGPFTIEYVNPADNPRKSQ